MTKQFILIGVLALSISACSKGSSGGGSGGGGNDNNQKPPGQQDSSTQQFSESYQLELNGCNTTKHVFGSDVSYEEVRKQLCGALQDDKLNGSCAEPLRKEFFDKKCSGLSWSPKYEPVTPIQPAPSPSIPSDNVDYVTQAKVENALKFVLVDKYEISSSLSAQEKQAATQFAEDMMSCGLSYLGPKCLNYETLAGNYGGTLSQVDGKSIFYSELKIKGAGTIVALLFKVDRVQPTVKVETVEVSKILKPRNGQSLDQYLKDTSALGSMVKVSIIAPNFQAAATKRLQNPRDIRELFHVSKMLLESNMRGNNYQASRAVVANAIVKNKNLIISTRDRRYQEEMLNFVTEIGLKKDTLIEICERLINSSVENVEQIAATVILDAQPIRTELKPVVLKALNNPRWDIRKKAISALSKVQKTTTEENQLISRIGDTDDDVRKEAISATSKISVNNGHLNVAKDLSAKSNWEVRLEAAKLLSRISSAESLEVLIGMMSDSDDDVRKQTVSLLNQRNLNGTWSADFAKQMNSPNWEVRRDAVTFLGKISSDHALSSLIGKMDDTDDDVRANIIKQLGSKQIKDIFIQALSEKYKSKNWEVRRDVSVLLGRNFSLSSTTALISQMNDTDEDVRTKIYTILNSRSLTAESVDNLKKNFSSHAWEVRRDVAKLLGKIRSQSSVDALEIQLTKETDDDVKNQIIASIKAAKN